MREKQIGELNGIWAMLFKTVLVVVSLFVPSIIVFNSWLVRQVYDFKTDMAVLQFQMKALTEEDYISHDQVGTLLLRAESGLMQKVSENFPPEWLVKNVENLDKKIEFQATAVEQNKVEINRVRNRVDKLED